MADKDYFFQAHNDGFPDEWVQCSTRFGNKIHATPRAHFNGPQLDIPNRKTFCGFECDVVDDQIQFAVYHGTGHGGKEYRLTKTSRPHYASPLLCVNCVNEVAWVHQLRAHQVIVKALVDGRKSG